MVINKSLLQENHFTVHSFHLQKCTIIHNNTNDGPHCWQIHDGMCMGKCNLLGVGGMPHLWLLLTLLMTSHNMKPSQSSWYLSVGNTTLSLYIDGLVQELRNSSAIAMELHLSCTNPLMWWFFLKKTYLDFLSFLYTMKAQVFDILLHLRKGPIEIPRHQRQGSI